MPLPSSTQIVYLGNCTLFFRKVLESKHSAYHHISSQLKSDGTINTKFNQYYLITLKQPRNIVAINEEKETTQKHFAFDFIVAYCTHTHTNKYFAFTYVFKPIGLVIKW